METHEVHTHTHTNVHKYMTMPRLAAKFQVGNQGAHVRLIDHVPVMLHMEQQFVHTPDSPRFQWDSEKLNVALHHVANVDRRVFVDAVETNGWTKKRSGNLFGMKPQLTGVGIC